MWEGGLGQAEEPRLPFRPPPPPPPATVSRGLTRPLEPLPLPLALPSPLDHSRGSEPHSARGARTHSLSFGCPAGQGVWGWCGPRRASPRDRTAQAPGVGWRSLRCVAGGVLPDRQGKEEVIPCPVRPPGRRLLCKELSARTVFLGGGAGMHWNTERYPPPPFQGAQPMPRHCP